MRGHTRRLIESVDRQLVDIQVQLQKITDIAEELVKLAGEKVRDAESL